MQRAWIRIAMTFMRANFIKCLMRHVVKASVTTRASKNLNHKTSKKVRLIIVNPNHAFKHRCSCSSLCIYPGYLSLQSVQTRVINQMQNATCSNSLFSILCSMHIVMEYAMYEYASCYECTKTRVNFVKTHQFPFVADEELMQCIRYSDSIVAFQGICGRRQR